MSDLPVAVDGVEKGKTCKTVRLSSNVIQMLYSLYRTNHYADNGCIKTPVQSWNATIPSTRSTSDMSTQTPKQTPIQNFPSHALS